MEGADVTARTRCEGAAAAHARRRLRAIKRVRGRLGRLKAEAQEELARVSARYDGRIAALEGRLRTMTDRLEQHCRRHRDELFVGGARSLVAPGGRFGFRRTPRRLRLGRGMEPEEVCRRLTEEGLSHFVRVRRSPDLRALLGAVRDGRLEAELLRGCGLSLEPPKERFHCSVDADTGA